MVCGVGALRNDTSEHAKYLYMDEGRLDYRENGEGLSPIRRYSVESESTQDNQGRVDAQINVEYGNGRTAEKVVGNENPAQADPDSDKRDIWSST
jgi:hypothetical protein